MGFSRLFIIIFVVLVTAPSFGQTKDLRVIKCSNCGADTRKTDCGCTGDESKESLECKRAKSKLTEKVLNTSNSVGGRSEKDIAALSCGLAKLLAEIYTDFKSDAEIEFDRRVKNSGLDSESEFYNRELGAETSNIKKNLEALKTAMAANASTSGVASYTSKLVDLLNNGLDSLATAPSPQSLYGGVHPMDVALENVSALQGLTPVPEYISGDLGSKISELINTVTAVSLSEPVIDDGEVSDIIRRSSFFDDKATRYTIGLREESIFENKWSEFHASLSASQDSNYPNSFLFTQRGPVRDEASSPLGAGIFPERSKRRSKRSFFSASFLPPHARQVLIERIEKGRFVVLAHYDSGSFDSHSVDVSHKISADDIRRIQGLFLSGLPNLTELRVERLRKLREVRLLTDDIVGLTN